VFVAGSALTGLSAVFALFAAVLVLKLKPNDFVEEFDGGALPRLVSAQRGPTTLAFASAFLALVGTILLAVGR
jgi:hypothetical protein